MIPDLIKLIPDTQTKIYNIDSLSSNDKLTTDKLQRNPYFSRHLIQLWKGTPAATATLTERKKRWCHFASRGRPDLDCLLTDKAVALVGGQKQLRKLLSTITHLQKV